MPRPGSDPGRQANEPSVPFYFVTARRIPSGHEKFDGTGPMV